MSKNFGKVGVLFGGRSAEREVSLISGKAVLAGLQRAGVDAHAFDPAEHSLDELAAQKFDRVFIALHGRFGEDGTIQGVLEYLGIPYTGSGVAASAIAMDKWRTKMLWLQAGLPTPPFELLDAGTDFDAVIAKLGLPIFVKPANEGSSIGIGKANDLAGLKQAYANAARYDNIVIAERFIKGMEVQVPVLGEGTLPSIRIETPHEFYDYDAKYLANDTRYHCPSGLPEAQEAQLAKLTRDAFAVLGCHGWGRADLMVDAAGNAYLLEMNTIPGMTDHSLVPMAARAAGMSFDALVLKILEQAHVG